MHELNQYFSNLRKRQKRQRPPGSSRRQSLKALDRLNLSLGDVRDVFEPYLSIYLAVNHHWNPAQIGIAISTTSVAGILAQTPAGALVDSLRQKRLLVAISTLAVAVCYIVIVRFSALPIVVGAQAIIGASAIIVGPTVAAISLGLVGPEHLEKRIGRNEAFNHTGNVASATVAGLLGQFIGLEWIFYLFAVLCVATIASVFRIQEKCIDYSLAHGGEGDAEEAEAKPDSNNKASIKDLLSDRRILIFAAAVVLYHFGNAAQLPLVSQELSGGKATGVSFYVSACIVVAQLIMIPIAPWTAAKANSWGRKPIFLIAFAIVPLRALLYTLNSNPYFLISVQILDGIAAGIFSVLVIIVVADLTKGTGRFNLAQGAINTTIGIGASLSNLVAGFVVKAAGYRTGFFTLAAIAAVAFGLFLVAMPETKENQDEAM